MQLREIDYVIAVAKYKSISLAAEKLHISQPALSRFIRSFEEQLGVELFARGLQGVKLTESGEIYIEAASQIKGIIDVLNRDLEEVGMTVRGQLRIAIPAFLDAKFLPKALGIFHTRFPEVEIVVYEEDSRGLERMLERGDADVVVMGRMAFPANVSYVSMESYELLLVAHKDDPICRKARKIEGQKYLQLTVGDIGGRSVILDRQGWHIRDLMDSYFQTYQFEPGQIIEITNNDTKMHVLAAGLGVAFLPGEIFKNHPVMPDLRLFSVDSHRLQWEIVVAYHRNSFFPRVTNEFIKVLQDNRHQILDYDPYCPNKVKYDGYDMD
ncbi:LysR family transcriptional regulator [Oscillospiraceae bacterium OttesenSCG-928-F05]|nr:LysR family transcriptional regulator [Oscillospiraceae bacterium OttesenSCG-928-F05]